MSRTWRHIRVGMSFRGMPRPAPTEILSPTRCQQFSGPRKASSGRWWSDGPVRSQGGLRRGQAGGGLRRSGRETEPDKLTGASDSGRVRAAPATLRAYRRPAHRDKAVLTAVDSPPVLLCGPILTFDGGNLPYQRLPTDPLAGVCFTQIPG